jgi:methyl-accepting chemotaxis protein
MIFSLAGIGAGLACGLLCGGLLALRVFKILSRARAVHQLEQQEQHEVVQGLRQEIEDLLHHLAQADAALDEERAQAQSRIQQVQDAHDNVANTTRSLVLGGKENALTSCQSVDKGVKDLLGAVKTFERWHTDMNTLIKHNRHMHNMNEDFASIVKQMVVVTLNASIEAAKAGEQGRGFSEVAKELRSLATRAENLSNDYRRNLYENDLITTITFQDLQAGGKMIIGSVVGLGLENDKTRKSLSV